MNKSRVKKVAEIKQQMLWCGHGFITPAEARGLRQSQDERDFLSSSMQLYQEKPNLLPESPGK